MLTARCLRNFSTDTGHPHQNGMRFPNMIGLLRDGNFGLLKLSKAFKFAIQQAMSKAFDMPIPFETAAGAWHTNINSSFNLEAARKLGCMVFTSSICVGR